MYIRLGVGLSILLLGALDLSPNNVLPNIVFLAQVEELADLGGTFRAETLGENVVGEAGDFLLALFDDDKRENCDIGANDAPTNRLALALTGTAGSVARVAVCEEELDTVREQNTLLHRESLLVVSTSDTEDITLPLVSNRVTRNLLGHFLVVEDTAGSRSSGCIQKTRKSTRTSASHRRNREVFEPQWRGLF